MNIEYRTSNVAHRTARRRFVRRWMFDLRYSVVLLLLSGPARAVEAPAERQTSIAPSRMQATKPVEKTHGKLSVEFIGAKVFKPKRLQAEISRQIKAIEESQLDEASADDAAFFLANFYKKQGYSQVEVRPEIAGPNQ